MRVGVAFGAVLADDPVAAGALGALVGASVRLDGVAIVAGFKALGVLGQVHTRHAVPAAGSLARVGARVGVVGVSVVAGLARFKAPVAAARRAVAHDHLF